MPDFEYTAHLKTGQLQKGTITARDRNAAMAALRENQLLPVIIKESGKKKGLGMEINLPGGGKAKPKDLVIFTRQLSTMVSAFLQLSRFKVCCIFKVGH